MSSFAGGNMPIFERKFFFSKTCHFRRFIRISSQYCHSCVLNNFNILLVETNFPILNLIVCFPEDLNRNRKPDDYCMFASYCSRILRRYIQLLRTCDTFGV